MPPAFAGFTFIGVLFKDLCILIVANTLRDSIGYLHYFLDHAVRSQTRISPGWRLSHTQYGTAVMAISVLAGAELR